jgi:Plasmid pRiA4b ORF-3-like protein
VRYPRSIKARDRCRPEDCGGPLGYAEILEAIADPKHEQRDDNRAHGLIDRRRTGPSHLANDDVVVFRR